MGRCRSGRSGPPAKWLWGEELHPGFESLPPRLYALVAQWMRASPCGGEGRAFESRRGCSGQSRFPPIAAGTCSLCTSRIACAGNYSAAATQVAPFGPPAHRPPARSASAAPLPFVPSRIRAIFADGPIPAQRGAGCSPHREAQRRCAPTIRARAGSQSGAAAATQVAPFGPPACRPPARSASAAPLPFVPSRIRAPFVDGPIPAQRGAGYSPHREAQRRCAPTIRARAGLRSGAAAATQVAPGGPPACRPPARSVSAALLPLVDGPIPAQRGAGYSPHRVEAQRRCAPIIRARIGSQQRRRLKSLLLGLRPTDRLRGRRRLRPYHSCLRVFAPHSWTARSRRNGARATVAVRRSGGDSSRSFWASGPPTACAVGVGCAPTIRAFAYSRSIRGRPDPGATGRGLQLQPSPSRGAASLRPYHSRSRRVAVRRSGGDSSRPWRASDPPTACAVGVGCALTIRAFAHSRPIRGRPDPGGRRAA